MIVEAGGEAAVHLADISDAAQARGLIEAAVARFGRLDVLVNNASVRRQTKFSELTVEEWREILGTTLDGAFYCVHAAAPHILAAGGGSIVNLGGISAHLGAKGRVHAVTAKAGMLGLTRALAKELAPTITVNCVVPGTIDTVRGFAAGGNAGRASLPDNLIGRAGKPEEIAEMVRYLCSPSGAIHHRADDAREWWRVHAVGPVIARSGATKQSPSRSAPRWRLLRSARNDSGTLAL